MIRLFAFSGLIFCFTAATNADTLHLITPTGISVPANSHVDGYPFPTSLISTSNAMTKLGIAYQGTFNPNAHQIVSTNILFDAADVQSIDVATSTPTFYDASVRFSVPVTGVSGSGSAFSAVHSHVNGFSLTQIIWTATYADGSQRQAINGIIPEPTSCSAVAASWLLLCRRNRRAGLQPGLRRQTSSTAP